MIRSNELSCPLTKGLMPAYLQISFARDRRIGWVFLLYTCRGNRYIVCSGGYLQASIAPQKSNSRVAVKKRLNPRDARPQLHHRFCSKREATLLPCQRPSLDTRGLFGLFLLGLQLRGAQHCPMISQTFAKPSSSSKLMLQAFLASAGQISLRAASSRSPYNG